MGSRAFYHLLNMSIIGSVSGLIIVITGKLVGRYLPKRIIFALWGIVAFRFVMPISLSSTYSIANLIGSHITKAIPVNLGQSTFRLAESVSYFNSLLLVESYSPFVYNSGFVEKVFKMAGAVWLGGAVIFIIAAVIIYTLASKRLITTAVSLNDSSQAVNCSKLLNLTNPGAVLESAELRTAVVRGIMSPTVIIPCGLNVRTMRYVLLHEYSHIKRRDSFWRWLGILIACVHWFNPFVWLFLHLSEKDMEKACDEQVLKLLKIEQRKEYAAALIELADMQRTPLLALGNTAVKDRIINIVNYRKMPLIFMAISSLLLILGAVALITNPIIESIAYQAIGF